MKIYICIVSIQSLWFRLKQNYWKSIIKLRFYCILQAVVAFTADLPPSPHGGADSRGNILEERIEGKGVYCADLNNPWEYK